MTNFKLLGNRILLDMPVQEDTKLIVDENTKEALAKEMLEKIRKLKVFAVGDLVTNVNVGDEILVEPSILQKALGVPIGKETKLLISPFDVILIWKS